MSVVRRAPLLLLVLAALACEEAAAPDAPDPLVEDGHAFVAEPAVGRAALEASLVDPTNGYSALRLARYAPERWGALPAWRPRVRAIMVHELGGSPPTEGFEDWWGAWADDALPADRAGIEALGARAFTHFPAQVVPALRSVLGDAEAATTVGLIPDADGRLSGLVWVEVPGGVEPALTCATCHSDGVAGRPNMAFDLGAVYDLAAQSRTARGRWGPGRVDVTGDGVDNPTAFPDLRPIRFQTHLHRAATVRNGLLPLAVRIETLMITSTGEAWRPPRSVAFALAAYLWSMGDALPPPAEGAGRAVFAATCARCHAGEGLAGAPVPIDDVGTADAVARSPERGTGRWRVPSLRGVADRRLLFASGGVRGGVEELLDPARAAAGHPVGLDLPAAERRALVGWLEGL